jgi:hypothetical protein
MLPIIPLAHIAILKATFGQKFVWLACVPVVGECIAREFFCGTACQHGSLLSIANSASDQVSPWRRISRSILFADPLNRVIQQESVAHVGQS